MIIYILTLFPRRGVSVNRPRSNPWTARRSGRPVDGPCDLPRHREAEPLGSAGLRDGLDICRAVECRTRPRSNVRLSSACTSACEKSSVSERQYGIRGVLKNNVISMSSRACVRPSTPTEHSRRHSRCAYDPVGSGCITTRKAPVGAGLCHDGASKEVEGGARGVSLAVRNAHHAP